MTKQIQNSNAQNDDSVAVDCCFGFWPLNFKICFGFSALNLGFPVYPG